MSGRSIRHALGALARFAEGRGIVIEGVGRAELDRRAVGGRHQGALALAPELALIAVEEIALGPTSIVVAPWRNDGSSLRNSDAPMTRRIASSVEGFSSSVNKGVGIEKTVLVSVRPPWSCSVA